MPTGYELSLPDEALKRMEYKGYRLRSYERSSINEISSMLQNGGYTDRETVHEHILYLRQLADRLSTILYTQQNCGQKCAALPEEIRQIKKMVEALYMLEDDMPSRWDFA